MRWSRLDTGKLKTKQKLNVLHSLPYLFGKKIGTQSHLAKFLTRVIMFQTLLPASPDGMHITILASNKEDDHSKEEQREEVQNEGNHKNLNADNSYFCDGNNDSGCFVTDVDDDKTDSDKV